MKNQFYTGTPTSRRQVTCPTAITAGMPVLVGIEPAVALDDYQANIGGTTFLFNGSFTLTVIGRTSESPVVTAGIKPGDQLYAVGTLDTATNVTYNLTIDVNTGGTKFGFLDPSANAITAGSTDTAAIVRLVQ